MHRATKLPSSIVTILHEYGFPENFSKEGIRKAVQCEEDLIVITSKIVEQAQIAATLALLNSRLANCSAMIVVRTSQEARLIYRFLNPMIAEENYLDDPSFNLKHRLVNSTIRVASTFMNFNGNCYPSSSNCIIVTSYHHLLRNLLYRRSNEAEVRNKVTLPLTSTYIFVNPLYENRNKKLTIDIVDNIIFLKRKTWSTKNKLHYITSGDFQSDQLQRTFQAKTVIEVTEPNNNNQNFAAEVDNRDFIKSKISFMILMRTYSGHPTKQELIRKIKESVICNFICTDLSAKEKVEKIVEEEFHQIFTMLTTKNKLEDFALITQAGEQTGRYYLTPFGKRFLIASTYFEEIQNNPILVIEMIKEKMTNKQLDWNEITEIFQTFSNGRITYDDLQVLLERLEAKELQPDDDFFNNIFSEKNSYSLFKVHKLLSCFQKTMSENARKRFSLIGKVVSTNNDSIEIDSGKRDKIAILQAVKEELLLASEPLTKNQIILNLSLQKEEVTKALTKIEVDYESLHTFVVKPPIGKSVKYYSFNELPSFYFKKCGDCYFYGKNKCNFWNDIIEKAERKVPEKFLPYIKTSNLQRRTVACEAFVETETMEITMSLSEFYDSTPTEFVSFSDNNEDEFAHYCQFCLKDGKKVHIKAFGSRNFPQQGSIPNKCPRCGSSFKLEQERIEVASDD